MRSLYFDLRGRVRTLSFDDPTPGVLDVRVRTTASVISTGTETQGLRHNRRSLLQKARGEKDALRRAWSMARSGTLRDALRGKAPKGIPFANKLHKVWPLGYSAAGVVEAAGEEADLARGARVSCMGHPHADVMCLSRSMVAPVPEGVTDERAAFGAIGAIALRGVHRSGSALGDVVVVVGLGLVGLLTVQLLRAYGVTVIGSDPLPERRDRAIALGATTAFDPSDAAGERVAAELAGARGADAVIVAAGTSSSSPIVLASRLVGERGRVVVLGATGLTLPRGELYAKETDVVFSRSYGPGRHDPAFETQARPYVADDLAWDQRANLEEFLRLVATARVTPDALVTSRVSFEAAAGAYDALIASPASNVAVVIGYEGPAPAADRPPAVVTRPAPVPVAVIGCGDFARRVHLPNLAGSPRFEIAHVVGRNSGRAHAAAKAVGREGAGTDLEASLGDRRVEAVFVLTRHDTHAALTRRSLEAGKAVFVEKPIALTMADADAVCAVASERGLPVAVGFNRRLSPLSLRARALATARRTPAQLAVRVAGTYLPADHWVYDPRVGGGRIVGEMCHFIDYMAWLLGSVITGVQASGGALTHAGASLVDNVSATYRTEDGSVATLVYTDLGRVEFPKERIELFTGAHVVVIDDFVSLSVAGEAGAGLGLARADKGFERELDAFADLVAGKRGVPASELAGALATGDDGRRALHWSLETERAIGGRDSS